MDGLWPGSNAARLILCMDKMQMHFHCRKLFLIIAKRERQTKTKTARDRQREGAPRVPVCLAVTCHLHFW